ncbi:MAG TPA: UDP-N-acetylglucosamine 2-epimerase (non-hydrolyzing) [Candidatus Dormibacteraeota bacterium]|nr:UDP-N-acetylglucosamine 2-epimerase (non-hydrolyzing) [Candidatus Dormibacteraeota bacterium]
MRILTVVGARPQFIKAAPVSRVLRQHHTEFLLHTGQHYDDAMSELFFRQLQIPAPDLNLNVGSGRQGEQTAAMLAGIERVTLEQHPDWILVYGDTNSTLAGALAGAKLHIPVAHVEAGLRSYDRRMPEEINRVVADHVSELLLCPTDVAVSNLAREGITAGARMVGDVMLDAYQQHLDLARRSPGVLGELGLEAGGYALLTVHRAENVDEPANLRSILAGVDRSGSKTVFPVHPRTRAALGANGVSPPANVSLVDPVGYLEMLVLEENAAVIVTDSGGVQKEAYFAGRPCVTLREVTEWTDTVAAGWNVLVGRNVDAIASAIRDFRPRGERPALFGDGHAAERVVDALSAVKVANP